MFDENQKVNCGFFHFIPPKPIKKFVYLCDKKFHTELIMDLYKIEDDYGIIHLDGNEYTFYAINGDDIYEITGTTRKKLPKNHKRGGQSQNRFQRLRSEAINKYLGNVNQSSIDLFINPTNGLPIIKGLIVIGSGDKKNTFIKNILDVRLAKILISNITAEYFESDNIIEIVSNHQKQQSNMKLNEFFSINNEDKLEYGIKNVYDLLLEGYLEKIALIPIVKYKFKEKNIDIDDQCKKVGCSMIILDNYKLEEFGGLIGLRWF